MEELEELKKSRERQT